MFLIYIVILLLVVILLMLSGYRFLVQYRIRQIETIKNLSESARKKILLIKQKEQEKHVQILLINGLLIGLIAVGVTITQLQTDGKVAILRAQTETLKDESYSLKQEQKQLITKVPIKEYPTEGIGLKDYSWDRLFEGSQKASLQSEIESKLSQKIVPYFGLSTFVLSIDVPSKTLSLSLIGDADYSANQQSLQKNIAAFVKEAEPITQFTQIQFQIDAVSKKKNSTVYSCTYGRDDVAHAFELLAETDTTKGED